MVIANTGVRSVTILIYYTKLQETVLRKFVENKPVIPNEMVQWQTQSGSPLSDSGRRNPKHSDPYTLDWSRCPYPSAQATVLPQAEFDRRQDKG